jgi:hypothetical protein
VLAVHGVALLHPLGEWKIAGETYVYDAIPQQL